MAHNILVVDDSAVIRRIHTQTLAKLGFTEIHEAANGKEAILKLRDLDFNVCLILLDCNMPEMDGFTFLKKLRAIKSLDDIPIVMVTTEGGQDRINEALELGANGYLLKPFTPEQIWEHIDSIRRHPRFREKFY